VLDVAIDPNGRVAIRRVVAVQHVYFVLLGFQPVDDRGLGTAFASVHRRFAERQVAGNDVGGVDRANQRHPGERQRHEDDQRHEQDDTALAWRAVAGKRWCRYRFVP
jgi:hypothetical protein